MIRPAKILCFRCTGMRKNKTLGRKTSGNSKSEGENKLRKMHDFHVKHAKTLFKNAFWNLANLTQSCTGNQPFLDLTKDGNSAKETTFFVTFFEEYMNSENNQKLNSESNQILSRYLTFY